MRFQFPLGIISIARTNRIFRFWLGSICGTFNSLLGLFLSHLVSYERGKAISFQLSIPSWDYFYRTRFEDSNYFPATNDYIFQFPLGIISIAPKPIWKLRVVWLSGFSFNSLLGLFLSHFLSSWLSTRPDRTTAAFNSLLGLFLSHREALCRLSKGLQNLPFNSLLGLFLSHR